jgi:hypothetical protein
MSFFFKSISKDKNSLSKGWYNYFGRKENRISRLHAIYISELLREGNSQYFGLLSEKLTEALEKINKVVPDNSGGLFCDVPLPRLWIELGINQLGHPYHFNLANHRRHTYQAKERKMFVDIFQFDKCRSLYDWLPLINFYGEDLANIERQMIVRSCIDAIGKHSRFCLYNLYYGAALVGLNEKSWSKSKRIQERVLLD